MSILPHSKRVQDILDDNPHPSVKQAHVLDSNPGNTSIATYRGYSFDIFDPSTWIFDLEEIAQALSNTCRFGGHVEFYSVAEHSIRVAKMLGDWELDPKVQLIGLMHDAIEAYIGDIPRPIKKSFVLDGEPITELEKSMEYALFRAYDLLDADFDETWKLVKKADMAVYELERDERPTVGVGLLPPAAKRQFVQHYTFLEDQLD